MILRLPGRKRVKEISTARCTMCEGRRREVCYKEHGVGEEAQQSQSQSQS